MANPNTNAKLPKLVQVTLDEYETFNDVISTATLSSSDLEKKIAELFGSIFVDFEGCKIAPVGEVLKCKLYFKPCFNKGEGLYAVKVRGKETSSRKDSKLLELVNTVNMYASSKQFDLEDIAKEMLAEFLVIPTNNAKVVERYNEDLQKEVKVRLPKDWSHYTEEVTDTIQNTRFQNPYLVVNIDLIPTVAKMYGKKDLTEVKSFADRGIIPKDRYQYAVNIVKVLNVTMKQYILEIRKIDIKAMENLSKSIGYGMVTGNIVMTRK